MTALEEFLDSQRARRAAAGKPDHIDDASLYRVLDGLLASRRQAVSDVGHADALAAVGRALRGE